jgi:hypothetical protein
MRNRQEDGRGEEGSEVASVHLSLLISAYLPPSTMHLPFT